MINILNKIKIKRFDTKIEKCREIAKKIYDKKQNTVVCKYCGQLLPKNEAGCVYNIKNNTLEFFHEDCFQENEHIGTLEELMESEVEE